MLDGPGRGQDPLSLTRVRTYAVLAAGSERMAEALLALQRPQAAVVVWGVRGDHRQVVVARRGYERMRNEAVSAARLAGVDTAGMLADVSPVGQVRRGQRAPVLLATASSRELSTAVQPLLTAGVILRSVVTPADALASLARARRDASRPDAIDAYLALEDTNTAIALVRNGSLLGARELGWGYRAEGALLPREVVAGRLASTLASVFAEADVEARDVHHVCICGSMPELRSMTAPLMEQLDVEVEPLDSLFGIDAEHLPEPADEFRESSASLRLAWAVAADWQAPINLMRSRQRRKRQWAIARGAVAAGAIAGLGLGWRIEQSAWWSARQPPRSARVAVPVPPPPAPVRRVVPAPAPAPASAPATTTPLSATIAPSTTTVPPARSAPPTTSAATSAATSTRATTSVATSTRATTSAATSTRATTSAATSIRATTSAPITSAATSTRATTSAPTTSAVTSTRATTSVPVVVQRPVIVPPPIPLDAVLGTILYGPDRKLAIVDGRIVGIGDEVKGARVTDITPTSVLLRDADGRPRIISAGSARRQP